MCWQINKLREVWQTQNPMSNRFSCDSFVLSLRVYLDQYLYCGLNNGTLQIWDLNKNYGTKLTEKKIHNKGVKTIDVSDEYIVTGSYDFTVKIWNKTSDITEC